jgi:hypothetical protein
MDTFSLLFSAPSPKVEKTIEVNLEDLEQFFNTMDPSPFHEKDLDHDLEEFIVSWATEYYLRRTQIREGREEKEISPRRTRLRHVHAQLHPA